MLISGLILPQNWNQGKAVWCRSSKAKTLILPQNWNQGKACTQYIEYVYGLFYLKIGTKAKQLGYEGSADTGLFYLKIGTKAKLSNYHWFVLISLFYLKIGTKAKQCYGNI